MINSAIARQQAQILQSMSQTEMDKLKASIKQLEQQSLRGLTEDFLDNSLWPILKKHLTKLKFFPVRMQIIQTLSILSFSETTVNNEIMPVLLKVAKCNASFKEATFEYCLSSQQVSEKVINNVCESLIDFLDLLNSPRLLKSQYRATIIEIAIDYVTDSRVSDYNRGRLKTFLPFNSKIHGANPENASEVNASPGITPPMSAPIEIKIYPHNSGTKKS